MATTYHELIVKGDREVLDGFLEGFMAAKNIKSGIILASEHPIETHHLKEILTFHGLRAPEISLPRDLFSIYPRFR